VRARRMRPKKGPELEELLREFTPRRFSSKGAGLSQEFFELIIHLDNQLF
jgi:hypothetical protein